eukprot:m.209432 g.209432  ORF g.209432 m.209432 type:complete len:1116 (-) comp26104_c0_seq3:129-3476(-)
MQALLLLLALVAGIQAAPPPSSCPRPTLDDSGDTISCEQRSCPSGSTCVSLSNGKICCPEYPSCELKPCKANEKCVEKPIECVTTPCAQYSCEELVRECESEDECSAGQFCRTCSDGSSTCEDKAAVGQPCENFSECGGTVCQDFDADGNEVICQARLDLPNIADIPGTCCKKTDLCRNIKCAYGIKYTYDANKCVESCECAPDPCSVVRCSAGYVCERQVAPCLVAPCPYTGTCVKEKTPECTGGREWRECGTCEGTCGEPNPVCTADCKPARCQCPNGKVWFKDSCIDAESCPAKCSSDSECGQGERCETCLGSDAGYCEEALSLGSKCAVMNRCALKCSSGLECQDSFNQMAVDGPGVCCKPTKVTCPTTCKKVKKTLDENNCMTACECDDEPECPAGQEYQTCASACPSTCDNPKPLCLAVCRPGCACPKNQVLHEGKCIDLSKCPVKDPCADNPCGTNAECIPQKVVCAKEPCPQYRCECPAGLEYKDCGTHCPATCDDASPICVDACAKGCFCPSGQVMHNGVCLPKEKCADCLLKPCAQFRCPAPPKGCTYIVERDECGCQQSCSKLDCTKECPVEKQCTAGRACCGEYETCVKADTKDGSVCQPMDTCTLPAEVGMCRAALLRYYFNSKSGKCETFSYGGCGGNANNFKTLADCNAKCDICHQPQQAGDCKAALPRYYFNTKTEKCELFSYGGCGGNDNNFKTAQECEKQCGKPQVNPCEQEKVVGPCEALMPRYFFNKVSKTCEKFYYGGCQGNENNFKTLAACQKTCGKQQQPTECKDGKDQNGDDCSCPNFCYHCKDKQCLACKSRRVLVEGACEKECPSGTVVRGSGLKDLTCSKPYLCDEAKESCKCATKKCNKCQVELDGEKCVSCAKGFHVENDACVKDYTCEDGLNTATEESCECDIKNCNKCLVSAAPKCFKCEADFYKLGVDQCVASCPNTHFVLESKQACEVNHICTGKVPSVELEQSSQCSCRSLDRKCTSCQLSADGIMCLSCRSRKFPVKEICESECPENTFSVFTKKGGTCQPAGFKCVNGKGEAAGWPVPIKCSCPNFCTQCIFNSATPTCKECTKKMYLRPDGTCGEDCPAGYDMEGSGRRGRECVPSEE